MPCRPLDLSGFILPDPPAGLSGFAPRQFDLNIPFPPIDLEDLQDLFDKLSFLIPPGLLKPGLSETFSKNILDGILSLLEKFMPFLMAYSFFLPLLNMILCIIEVLCSLMNPFKLARKIRKLFRVCIPAFLNLFPILALILMIISLLLLILALILYLIERLLRIIQMILKNILLLTKAARRLDNDGIIAIVRKIGGLLCILQNLFVIFGLILIIVAIIKSLLQLGFQIPPCDDEDTDGCCTPEVCPAFIRNNETITSNTGVLQYFNQVSIDSGIALPFGFAPILSNLREESWQFYDAALPLDQRFNNIIHAYDLPAGNRTIFFPEGITYNGNSNPQKVPYTVNMRAFYDPARFGRTDTQGARFVNILGCIVIKPPVDGVFTYNNNIIAPFDGTLTLAGGLVFEDTVETPVMLNGVQATLNTLIHQDPTISSSPSLNPTDGVLLDNMSYEFNINHGVLLSYDLITLGCMPEVALDKNFINNTLATTVNTNFAVLNGIVNSGTFPDVAAAQVCIANSITQYRQSISEESTAEFQSNILACLAQLQSDTVATLHDVIVAGFDPYKSTFVLDPSVQFTTLPVKLKVTLAESSGSNMANNLPASVAQLLADKLSANISFGEIGNFTYDGSAFFVADITSPIAGNGSVNVSFNNKLISILNNPADINQSPSVSIKSLNYTFVLSVAVDDGKVRRDEGDVARE